MNVDLDKFKKQGYIHLHKVIPADILKETRSRAIALKLKYKNRVGEPRHNGSGAFWNGLELASTLDPNLWKSYTSNFMYDISKLYLESEPYLFNDQVVVKLPDESFYFDPHYDNQFGPQGNHKTINCCWILTNMPVETGPLS
jgi:hypothetical protein